MSETKRPPIRGNYAATKLKNDLVRLDPELQVELRNVRINGSLQGCSGFVTNPRTGKIAYVCTDRNNMATTRALYRSAKHTRDFTGGTNRFATYDDLSRSVVELLRS